MQADATSTVAEPTVEVKVADLDQAHWLLTERVVPAFYKVQSARTPAELLEREAILSAHITRLAVAVDNLFPDGCPSSGWTPPPDDV